jgi:tetratricopeptide (TPR) repeat protein
MQSIRTLNLIWERRIRGTYPVSRYAVDDAGTVTLAVPRPLEARSYDLTRLTKDGTTEARAAFSVETLQELEVSASADNFLGMTVDDVYLFQKGAKGRFLEGKRLCIVDTAMSADGQKVIAGFSDMAGASYAIALGSVDGRVTWTRPVETPLTTLQVGRDGERIAIATETGVISLIDAGMRTLWDFGQEETVTALACSSDALLVAYGTVGGAVGLIDGNGSRQWEARLPGTIITLALSGDGGLCAALALVGDITHLYCLVGQGQIGWDFALEKRFLGLSLSENGQWIAVGAKDGTTALYEIVQSEWAGEGSDTTENLRRLLESEDFTPEIYGQIKAALQTPISDQDLVRQAEQWRKMWLEACRDVLTNYETPEDVERNLVQLKEAISVEPFEPELTSYYESLYSLHREIIIGRARRLPYEGGDAKEIAARLRELIVTFPFDLEAHLLLSGIHETDAAHADEEADALLSQGNLEAGVAALERAQSAHATTDRAAKIARARIALDFTEGLTHYNARRYQEAIFQFKKVLANDPDHSEARRYLGFAQSFLQDASNNALTDRFSMLE